MEGGINLYAYVGNNPLNFTDPDGTIPIETIADIIGIGVDITSLYDDPSWTNVAFLGWSIGAAVTPYVPGSWTARACKGANNARKLLTAPKTVKHHIFNKFRGFSQKSQKYRDFFKKHNIEVDKWTVEIPENMHKDQIHKMEQNRTTKWKEWIDANPNASTKDVYQFGGRMMDEYGISGLPLVPYR